MTLLVSQILNFLQQLLVLQLVLQKNNLLLPEPVLPVPRKAIRTRIRLHVRKQKNRDRYIPLEVIRSHLDKFHAT